MMQRSLGMALAVTTLLSGVSTNMQAQSKPAAKNGFETLPSGLQYKFVKHGKGKRKAQINDHVEINIVDHLQSGKKDSVMFSSVKMNNGQPVPLVIAEPKFKGDLMEGFKLMVAGDSVIFKLPVDSIVKMGGVPPGMKAGDFIVYNVGLVKLLSDAEAKKEKEERDAKQMSVDDKLLQSYFAKNNIKAQKTASGLYYSISQEGTGDKITAGKSVSVNYTGKLLDGSTFDSNVDSAFKHVQPFNLEVGRGMVIKGWDEGLQLLKNGCKATFYIPSPLAYGSQEQAKIPSNSVLIFDVQITDVKEPQPMIDDKIIREYLVKNNIQATKTHSGLYYVVKQPGTGDNVKPGKNVSVKYTGRTMDGKVFDSNDGPGKQPFTFSDGAGRVIRGWDEGLTMFNKGAKGTLFIPSGLGYGERGAGGSIPPNAVLMFDIEVTDIQ
jgi:FKBP-type peptidyl-prolyl cis-trans isomerase FkpA